MKQITHNIANTYIYNYKGVDNPRSLNYCDGYAISWLQSQAKRYGFGGDIEKMNDACKEFLRENTPPAKKQKLRIEVIKYIGKSGGFSSSVSERYRTELVGVNGNRRGINNWQSEGYGYSEIQYANQDAKAWAALLGCLISHVDLTKKEGAA